MQNPEHVVELEAKTQTDQTEVRKVDIYNSVSLLVGRVLLTLINVGV